MKTSEQSKSESHKKAVSTRKNRTEKGLVVYLDY